MGESTDFTCPALAVMARLVEGVPWGGGMGESMDFYLPCTHGHGLTGLSSQVVGQWRILESIVLKKSGAQKREVNPSHCDSPVLRTHENHDSWVHSSPQSHNSPISRTSESILTLQRHNSLVYRTLGIWNTPVYRIPKSHDSLVHRAPQALFLDVSMVCHDPETGVSAKG